MKKLILQNRKKLVLFGLFVLVVFLKIQTKELGPKDLEFSEVDQNTFKSELSSSDVQKDINHLIYALDNAYSAKDVYPQLYESLRSEIENIKVQNEKILVDDFLVQLDQIISKMPDGHFSVYKIENSTSSIGSISQTERTPSAENSQVIQSIRLAGKKSLILKLPSFEMELQNTDYEFIEPIKALLPSSEILVIDLRGNRGGYSAIPFQIAAMLWGQPYRENSNIQYFPNPIAKSGQSFNPVILALQKNSNILSRTKLGIQILKNTKAGLIDSLLNYNEYRPNDLRKKFAFNEYEFLPMTEVEENTLSDDGLNFKTNGFKKPIFLIVDEGCASACEQLVESLELHPFSKTIGSRTAGATQFGSIADLVLPNSRLAVRIPTSYVTYKDNRKVEKIGYQPKIRLDSGEDPIRKIELLVKNLK